MRHATRLLALLLLIGVTHAAPPKDKVKLAKRTQKGDRLLAHETSRTEITIHWKGEGEGAVGGEEVEEVEREYVQEVLKESPLTIKRDYKLSTRAKGKPKDDKVEPVRTSVHGKTVTFNGAEGHPDVVGGELSKEDRENLTTVERIAYSLLPKDEVAVGDSWKVADEMGKAIFHAFYSPENMKTAGTAKLESIKTVEGRRVAKLLLKAQLEIKPTEQIPHITLELKGAANFFVDEGAFQDLVLEGPLLYETSSVEGGKKRVASAEGRTIFRMKGTILAGAAVKPASKDDEIAKAAKLVCSGGHEFPNGFSFCGSCGKQLDAETKRCKGGCAPLLRHCVLCGEALAPKEEKK
jgi:hypothetical protein